jgi:leader peptidase (prepilin peptidase)/N-methyltransferase
MFLDPWTVVVGAWAAAALCVGLIVGSFANVVIHRLPRQESVVWPRSRCPACGAAIRPRDNVPVLSYLVLRGRCRDCAARIAPRYALVELANGVAYAALFIRFGPTLRTLSCMVLVTGLLVLASIDRDHLLLPDAITLPGIALGLLASLGAWPPTPLDALLSALGGYAAFALTARIARAYYGQEALGQGDWKLVAMMGAFFGHQLLFLTVLLGALAGAVTGGALMALGRAERTTRLPFGTFLSLAGMAVVFVGEPMLEWYRSLLRG